MKKLIIICLACTFLFAIEGKRYGRETNITPDPLTEQLHQAKRNHDKETYKTLMEQYKNRIIGENDYDHPVVRTVEDGYLGGPAFRWDSDYIIYAGVVNVNLWAGLNDIPDEAISVDYYRGDTLVAGVAGGDGNVWLLKSINRGMTWYPVYGWTLSPDTLLEPEVFYSPQGSYIHLFSRSNTGNGDIICLTVETSDSSWYQSWPQSTADTVRNFSACLDREDFDDDDYYIYLTWHYGLGQNNDGVIFRRSEDYGETWTAIDTILYSSAGYPDIVYGDNDDLFVTFFGRMGGNYDIGFYKSTDYGDNWTGEVLVETGTEVKRPPQIASAYNGSGNAWVVYSRKLATDYGLRGSQTTNAGANWSTPTYIFDKADSSEILPSISVYDGYNSSDSLPYTTLQRWYYDYTGDGVIYMLNWTGSDWAEVGTFNDSLPIVTRPIQTWEAPGVPAFAYVGHNAQNVYFDAWSNVAVEEDDNIIAQSEFTANVRPNPFTKATRIGYNLPTATRVTAKVYNTLGQLVTTLVDEVQASGDHAFEWNNVALPKGIYFLNIEITDNTSTKKLIIE
jgi:hypothetical protein